jgi:hypothetical protein
MSPSQAQTTKETRMVVRPTASIIPTMAPDDMSRATELAFTDGDWLGDALPPDDFAASNLADAELEGAGVWTAAAIGLEDVPEAAPGPFVGLRGVLE